MEKNNEDKMQTGIMYWDYVGLVLFPTSLCDDETAKC